MGIRGLTRYINSNRNFYEPYELHGGYLVIDGHNLAAMLYKRTSSGFNAAFGGDHDRYAETVSNFFIDLLKCDVTPLVILDGGMEPKKMKTKYVHMKETLKLAADHTSNPDQRKKLIPMACIIVFETVLKLKGIKLVRSVLEADPGIAGVAKVLNCPVLSFDSDFFVFGSMYVPLDTLGTINKKSQGNGYAIPCYLFRIENLLRTFPGLDSSVLPLVAVFLGNDYIDSTTFKHFFNFSEFPNQNQRRINLIFEWLKNYNLNDAVGAILNKLPEERRQKILDSIELVVNGYLILPCDMLVSLRFTEEYKAAMNAGSHQKKFKFQENIITSETRKLWLKYEIVATQCSSSDEEEETFLTSDVQNDSEEWNNRFISTWPSWFAVHYSIADFPLYFENMMRHRIFCGSVQIEDFQYPSANAISLKIVRVIDGLLVAGREESAVPLSIIIRDGMTFVRHRVDTIRCTKTTRFPALSDLRDTPMIIRTQIFNDTLEISNKRHLIEEIPAEWRVYVAAVVYWMRQSDEVSRNSCHLHSILFTMLLGIGDQKIGYHRNLKVFKKIYPIALRKLKSKQNRNNFLTTDTESDSVIEALKGVTENDCLAAAPVFISKCMIDPELRLFPQKFNVTIVHAFSQFQDCMKYAGHLNALLGCPYESPIIGNLFNGTLLYNLYTKFEKCLDVEAYITEVLKEAPGLLHLLKLLIAKVKMFFDTPITNDYRNEDRMQTKKQEILSESDNYDKCSTTDDDINENLTPKVKKLLGTDFADVYKGLGITKRKFKKKKRRQLFDYSMTMETGFCEEAMERHRSKKSGRRFWRYNKMDVTDKFD